jgi:Fusaric acid resistance protein-like
MTSGKAQNSSSSPSSRKGAAHLAEALRWSTAARIDRVTILGAGIGMAGPVLAGAAMGHLSAGLAAALGSLMVGGVAAGTSWRAQGREIIAASLPAVAAAVVAAATAGRGWPGDAGTVVLVGIVAALSGYSRPVAVMATRFILVLLIAATVAAGMPDQKGLLVLILAGALWAALVALVLGALARAGHRGEVACEAGSSSQPTAAQKRARWRRSLAQISGWHYTLRLTLCLGVAVGLRWLWPEHHFHWIALTVALLTERQIERLPVRTTQRALGTALGVLAAGALLVYQPPAWGLIVGIGVLAAARPFLRARNYLAYSAVMTPLIIVILDAGAPLGAGVLIDRLVATLIGAALVIGANMIFARAAATPATPA